VYNIETDPKVIEEGFNAAAELIYYLTTDGCKIKTPLFKPPRSRALFLSPGVLPVRPRSGRGFFPFFSVFFSMAKAKQLPAPI
jgi:hypothetical protein